MNILETRCAGAVLVAALLLTTTAMAQTTYNQATVGVYAPSTNAVEKSATVAPNDVTTFSNAVAGAYTTGAGGVFNFPTALTSGTTVYRGTYGTANAKRLTITSSVSMQGVGWPPSGSFHPVSYQYGTTSSANQSAYNLAIGPIADSVTAAEILSEQVTQIGFTVLSRTDTTFPADIKVTVSFSDGTTQSATANVGNPKGSDDTFFGFTAPSGQAITNVLMEAFDPGTTTPRATRIAWDDLGFITTPTGVLPPPQISDVYPVNGAVHWASNGLHFTASSETPINPAGISLLLNSTDVSSQLTITGATTNRSVSFSNLTPDLKYNTVITVSNLAGVVSITNIFYTPETNAVTIFDSGGFSDDTLYPVGYLTAVTNNDSRWVPALDPNSAEIVDLADGQHGKVLRRQLLGGDYIDHLLFPPVTSGTLIVGLDARVSSMDGRTLDLSVNSVTANGGGTQGPFLMWGTNALNYYNRTAWVPQMTLDTAWHHIELICYFTNGIPTPPGGTFDLKVDGVSVGEGLLWRSVTSSLGTLRIGSIRSDLLTQYGEVDNLVIKVAPAPLAAAPVTLVNPAHDGPTFSFSFQSLAGLNYLAQYNGDLGTAGWTNLITVEGDGTLKTVTHTNPPAGSLFYRVTSEVP